MAAITNMQTAEDRNEMYNHYLLLPGTDLPETILEELPRGALNMTRGEAKFQILRINRETLEAEVAAGWSAIHPNPAGEQTFSTATEITFEKNKSFRGQTELSAEAAFAIDTNCYALENSVGRQFTLARTSLSE